MDRTTHYVPYLSTVGEAALMLVKFFVDLTYADLHPRVPDLSRVTGFSLQTIGSTYPPLGSSAAGPSIF